MFEALSLLDTMNWPSNWNDPLYRQVAFGHCTRLTLFKSEEWLKLRERAQGYPISLVGLPTSDLFMMGRPGEEEEGGQRVRGTLQVLHIIQKYGINSAIGVNNVGNAFTPQGSCDPLSIASKCPLARSSRVTWTSRAPINVFEALAACLLQDHTSKSSALLKVMLTSRRYGSRPLPGSYQG